MIAGLGVMFKKSGFCPQGIGLGTGKRFSLLLVFCLYPAESHKFEQIPQDIPIFWTKMKLHTMPPKTYNK